MVGVCKNELTELIDASSLQREDGTDTEPCSSYEESRGESLPWFTDTKVNIDEAILNADTVCLGTDDSGYLLYPDVDIKTEPIEGEGMVGTPMYPNTDLSAQDPVWLDKRRLVVKVEPMSPELLQLYLDRARLRVGVKKRGRPKSKFTDTCRNKVKVALEASDLDLMFVETEPVSVDQNSENSRKRNRRKQKQPIKILKQALVQKISKPNKWISHPDNKLEIPEKRKRGRPKKVITSTDITEGVLDPSPKRKRKRKQVEPNLQLEKHFASATSAVAGEEKGLDAEESDTETKKKPKRKRTNKPKPEDPNPPQIGPCPQCHLKFHTDDELNSHSCCKFYKLPNGWFQCSLCPKSIALKRRMPAHMMKHTGESQLKFKV